MSPLTLLKYILYEAYKRNDNQIALNAHLILTAIDTVQAAARSLEEIIEESKEMPDEEQVRAFIESAAAHLIKSGAQVIEIDEAVEILMSVNGMTYDKIMQALAQWKVKHDRLTQT